MSGQPEYQSPGRGMPSRRAFVAGTATAAALATVPLTASAASASPASKLAKPLGNGQGGPAGSQRPDKELRQLLREVDASNIQATINKLVSFGTRHTLSSQTDPVRGIGAARDWIFAQLQGYAAASGGRMTVEKQSFVQQPASGIPAPTVITNLIATLTGDTDPNRVYVVSGHYDSRVTDLMNSTSDAPGADDDGSGVAVMLEMARLMATRHTEATIKFAAVAGEEQGLYGSAFFAAQVKAAGLDVQGMMTNDIVGSSTADDGTRDPHTLRLFAEGVPTAETPAQAAIRQAVGGENDGPARQLARFVSSVADNHATDMHVRIIWRRDRYLRGGDQISFLQQGFPAARFTEPAENFDHEHQDVRVVNGVQFGDLARFCDFDFIARVARVNLATFWSLAQAPGTPKNAGIVTTALTNDTTLTWDQGHDANLAGYEVVWRETTSPDWTTVLAVGNVTTATIDLSKDNLFFGVRAVGTGGLHSPVAFPRPVS